MEELNLAGRAVARRTHVLASSGRSGGDTHDILTSLDRMRRRRWRRKERTPFGHVNDEPRADRRCGQSIVLVVDYVEVL